MINNNSTHIPVCSSYSYKSLNVNRNNYTIRYIPYLCMDQTEKDVKKKHQEKNKVGGADRKLDQIKSIPTDYGIPKDLARKVTV